MKKYLPLISRLAKITAIYVGLMIAALLCCIVWKGMIVLFGLVTLIAAIVEFVAMLVISNDRVWRAIHTFMNLCCFATSFFVMLLISTTEVEHGPGEAALYFILTVMFLMLAVVATMIGGVFTFVGDNKFLIIISSLLGYAVYLLKKNFDSKEKDEDEFFDVEAEDEEPIPAASTTDDS